MSKGKILYKNILWATVSIGLLVLTWLVAAIALKSPLLPTPAVVFASMRELLLEGGFWNAFFESLIRCFLSLLLSFLIAMVLAVLSILYKVLHKILTPIVVVFRSIPTMSVIFMLIMFISPKKAPIYITFLVVMPMMYSMYITAFLATPRALIETGRIFGFNKLEEITKIHIPLSVPVIIESLSSSFSLSLKILVAAEVLASTANSIGYLLYAAKQYVEFERLLAITVTVVAFCIIFELIMRFINDLVSKSLYS